MGQTFARELARQIIEGDLRGLDAPTPINVAAAAERAFHRVSESLAHWVGSDGTQALFARALALAQARDPSLKAVQPPARSALFLDTLAANAEPADGAAVLNGVTLIMTTLIELLTRLVGDDLAVRLVAEAATGQNPDGVRPPDAERSS